MKKFNILIFFVLLCFSTLSVDAQDRYLDMVFDEVEVQTDVLYGANYTIITVPSTGHSALQPLVMDVYTPYGDTETARPLILYFHSGNFLPNPDNGSTTGTRNDSISVELCTRLAKMGYVVANVDYRLGWNPISEDINVRVSTLINAAYRGVQDSRSCVRYFQKSIAEEGNPFGICPDKITMMGEGTGGYITLASATLNEYIDVVIPKFIGDDINGDGIPDPMVIEAINGDIYGETILGLNPLNGDTFALPNHPGYSSDFQLCVNIGGALGDTSWLDANDPPFISFHVPDDPNAPYKE
ncbi:MAG: alpha/beta hydrolase, partial [Bacteroidetes bacterium]|nr:alpha/beta hydrolase [Bacteroidota bacterium]